MRGWTAEQLATAAGAELVRAAGGGPEAGGPERAVIDSRAAGAGTLFVGLPGVASTLRAWKALKK